MTNILQTIKKLSLITSVIVIALFAVTFSTNNTANACYGGDCYGGYTYNNYPYTYNNHDYIYPTYGNQQNDQLSISCYSNQTTGNIGDNITWRASAFGGNGSYYITWSGNDGLTGYGTSIIKNYYSAGSKYASVSVTSGSQTVSKNCGNNVEIYNYNNSNNYPNNNYNYNYNYNNPLYVSCSANTTYSPVNSSVTWTAYASGGNGTYSYSWNGTESTIGSGNIISTVYRYLGLKTASVTVYSNGQSVTQACSNTVNVTDQTYNYNYNYNTNTVVNTNTNVSNSIQIACYADNTSARTGTPVTWSVEATGSTGNFTYSWTGSENLTGNMSSIVKTYDNVGTKSATVSVTSSNGVSATQICGNTVSVNNGTTVVRNTNTSTVTKATTNTNNSNNNSAAALFSLEHVPWGWVAVLIILALLITVIYLIYNRNKI